MGGEKVERALAKFRTAYHAGSRSERSRILDMFCEVTGYHRKYAIVVLGRRADDAVAQPRRRRGPTYSATAIRVLTRIWEAAGYPWSERLKALLPLWLPWARKHVPGCTPEVEAQLLRMGSRQMDRRLAEKKRALKRRIYGKTKPGSLLRHQIPIKTDNWDVHEPGYCEIDLVSHSGPCASGEFIYSLNVTDIHTGWSETCAIMGKGEAGVVAALEEIRRRLPFPLKAIDSDNGSEFINHHLVRYCQVRGIGFTRSRPYKKNDNAHIEQKNWTHVRRIFAWDRYDTREQLDAMNRLYRKELRLMMNLFQPSVKLVQKHRAGSKPRRQYDKAQTPLDRLNKLDLRAQITHLVKQRESTNPFELSVAIEQQLRKLERRRRQPKVNAA